MPQTLFYSDFNCPFCYAMHERLAELDWAGLQWRGVQHAPFLSTPMQTWAGRLGEELTAEVLAVRRLMPDLPINTPRGKPNTRRVIAVAARAAGIDGVRAGRLIRSLYRALWVEGEDLSDTTVVTRLWTTAGYEERELQSCDSADIARRLADWEQNWIETGQGSVPLLLRADGELLVGLAGHEQLRIFLTEPCS